jgi:hypothetical protein
VTPEAYERGYYTKLYRALRQWTREAYPFTNPYYSNEDCPANGVSGVFS